MIELTPGENCADELKILIDGQLQLACPNERCLLAMYAPGSEATNFVDMAKEVDERAHLAVTAKSTLERGIVRCGYVALRSMTFLLKDHEPYELGALLMVFRTPERVLRRLAVPDLEENTPDHVQQMLVTRLVEAHEVLVRPICEQSEHELTNKIAGAVISGFADYAHRLRGLNG